MGIVFVVGGVFINLSQHPSGSSEGIESQIDTEITLPVSGSVKGKTDEKSLQGPFEVSRVIDGDTIELSGGQKVRYIGIDAPESVSPNTPVECFAVEASSRNKDLVEGKRIWLEKDVSETDRYGRLLRYVWIEDQSTSHASGWVMVNWELVRGGYAYSSTYPPDVKYQQDFLDAQSEAQKESLGLWSNCNRDEGDVDTRDRKEAENTSTESEGCVIKGNISSSGEKIYHLPSCRSYEKTKIDEDRGERWFCTEGEAKSYGWRKAKNCQ